MASYVCVNCDIDFGYPQGLAIHQELGCEWGDDSDTGDPNYCCGIIYEDGESMCMSCGSPVSSTRAASNRTDCPTFNCGSFRAP